MAQFCSQPTSMPQSILTFPPEIIVNILSFLPVPALLKFSQTCHYSHRLATSSLHTLSLGIHSTKVSGIISRLGATQFPRPKHIASAFTPPDYTASPPGPSLRSSYSTGNESAYLDEEDFEDNDPYRVTVLIPDAQSFTYTTLLNFHTALTRSILTRHGSTLRNLDLALWTLNLPVAKALCGLEALRSISLRIEDVPHVRAVPRSRVFSQRVEQREAWSLLTSNAKWAPRLNALRIEGGEMNGEQLATLLRKSRWCSELWLCKCSMIGTELWAFLGSEFEGRSDLKILGVMRCGGQIEDETLRIIGGMTSLQFLTLQGCHLYGVESEAVEEWNRDIWRIRECIPPQPRVEPGGESTLIEVDPAYLNAYGQ
ncbi:hypothetical protein P154DRAFT_72444 [Amniculicola lignicola CBS 123094]|uniref:F-box domain-containing protein n=1 Tax=Amniculicola lignicola CBS 123094 TaxID=1392246 RepID=A0A6A5WQM1_9PLEO|nr:hypothetical protein P154DRAFT_72444 [Amniculicola lignicola CBS 123094]